MKNKIKQIGYGISTAILLLPFMKVFAATQWAPTGTDGKYWNVADTQDTSGGNLSDKSVLVLIATAMRWLLIVVGIAGVMGFTIGGLMYIMSAGDEKKAEKAKTAIIASITGIVVAIAGVIALNAAQTFLGGTETF